MRGRTVSPVDTSVWENSSSYVQINIYDTNVKQLRERGVDIKNIIEQHVGCRSIIMDVPILKKERSDSEKEGCPMLSTDKITSKPSSLRGGKRGKYSTPSKTAKKKATSACRSASKSAEKIFQDCIQEYEEDQTRSKEPHSTNLCSNVTLPDENISSPSQPGYKDVEDLSESRCSKDKISKTEENNENLHEITMEDTAHTETERSFMEFSRKVVDGIHSMKLISKSALKSAVANEAVSEPRAKEQKPPTVQDDNVKDQTEKPVDLDTSYFLTDLTQDEHNVSHENAPLGIDKKTSGKSVSRKRRRCSTPLSQPSDDENAIKTVKNSDSKTENSQERVFHCKYPGCTAKVSWRPRYGKNRLVNHARVHWGKKMKKCCCCDYVAVHQTKILRHHRSSHADNKFIGAQSLETDEDMEELLELWKQCFPESRVLSCHFRR